MDNQTHNTHSPSTDPQQPTHPQQPTRSQQQPDGNPPRPSGYQHEGAHGQTQAYQPHEEGYRQPYGDPGQGPLIQLVRELDEAKRLTAAQAEQSRQDRERMRGQIRWLTGISAVAIVLLGGALIGITASLRQEQTALRESQDQLTAQVETLQTEQQADPEQLNRLEELLSSLNQNTENLTSQARELAENLPNASGEQLRAIQEDVQELRDNIGENISGEGAVERVNGLFRRIQGLLGESEEATPSGEQSGAESGSN